MKTLRQLRDERGVPRRVIANAIGVDQTTVYFWERGNNKPNEINRQKLAEYFDTPIDQIDFPPIRTAGRPRFREDACLVYATTDEK